MDYVYIRVSTKEQNTDRQEIAVSGFHVPEDHIFTDKQSGKDFDRPAYNHMVSVLHSGDTVIVKSIDRLGRDYDQIIVEWRRITKEIGANIVVLDMPLLDTRTRSGDITGVLIGDIVLQLLAYVAQKEREAICQRTREGLVAAKMRGVKLGRPSIEVPEEFYSVYQEWIDQRISMTKAAKKLGVSRSTFKKWADGVRE